MKYLILMISFLIICFSCTKDIEIVCDTPLKICESPITEISPVDTCFDLPLDAIGNVITNYHNDYYIAPRFSKSVEDEFIFLHIEINNEFKVYKSNLCNEYFEAGFDMSSLSNTKLHDINENDELLVSSGFKIWRVDFDGNNLFKVTNDESNYYGAQWCMNDTVILTYASGNNSPYFPGKALLLDKLGEVLHVFSEGIGIGDINDTGDKVAGYSINGSSREIGYIDLTTKEFFPIKEIINPYIGGATWLDEEYILYREVNNNLQKIFKLNILTKESILIYEKDCENIAIGEIIVSPFNKEEILTTRTEHRYVADHSDSLYYFRNIVKYNINTGEENILDLNL